MSSLLSFFPLGRLFWKFLLFFFLAQMVAVLGMGVVIWVEHGDAGVPPPCPPFVASGPATAGPMPPPERDAAATGAWQPRPDQERSGPERRPPPPFKHVVVGTLSSLIFAFLLAIYVSRPIQRLRQALQAGANGQLTPGIGAAMGNRRDELADLGRDFDRMAHHLAQLMEGQRRLLHDVSHELRSPLARLNAVIGLVRQQPEATADLLQRLEHESNRMDRLLSELLTLSRLESGMVEPGNEEVDLAELLADVVSDAEPEVGQAGCAVELKTPEGGALVSGNPEMLHRVFDNLLRNALKHAATGKWVGFCLAVEPEKVVVRVEDRGPGVPASELARLFVPFYRGAQASGWNGYGLGLAIAREIIENHHGHIEASNRREGGFCVTVTLPRLPA